MHVTRQRGPRAIAAAEDQPAKGPTGAEANLGRLKNLEGTWKGEGGTIGAKANPREPGGDEL